MGAERAKWFRGEPLPDPDAKVASCTTALKRPTVATSPTISPAPTRKRRDNITRHAVDSNKDDISQQEPPVVPEAAVRRGHSKPYRSDGSEHWHACVAKNTAHMAADDSHHVLCNVDGDNLLTLDFVAQCLKVACRIKKGSVGCAQFSATTEAGTYGSMMMMA